MSNTRYICNGDCAHCKFVRGSEYCNDGPVESRFAHKIDRVITNRWFGIPILVAVLFLVFELTFAIGAHPQKWIESGIDSLSFLVGSSIRPEWLSSLVADGIIRGVGAVLAFLPNIFLLFFFLSILEDSGYMARAAYLMDKLMHAIGLHGNSFIPMLLGFGCNVPAIMSAKSINNVKDRRLTMLMIPFMSCSARLPVYLLLVSAFFPRHKALVMISIYAAGILLSVLFAFIMKRTKYFRKGKNDDIFELPAFRVPPMREFWAHVWERCEDYLQKVTTVILAASVIIWALEFFPMQNGAAAAQDESCLARIGQWMEPAMAPLGFDWKMNVCILTGLPAKEAIVSTMGILYHGEEGMPLAETLRATEGFTPAAALAFMLFVLLYFPCIATIKTLRHEIGRKWTTFSVVNSIAVAWVVAFIVFRVGSLLL